MAKVKANKSITPLLFREVATAGDGRDITRNYGGLMNALMPQDSVLQGKGGDYALYEEVLRDDQVASTFQQRRMAVTSAEWGVRAGGDDQESRLAAGFIKEMLDHVGWDSVTDKMLYGVFYGYSVAECLWGREGVRVTLEAIKVRKQRRFVFDNLGKPMLLTPENPQGEPLPPQKFWHFHVGSDNDDEPYGLGLAHWLYWPVFFKRNGMKLWLIFMDKFGMPTAMGSYPVNATEEEKRRLLSALRAIQTDSGIIVPEGMKVELIESARGGQVSYETFLDRMNAAIAKVTLSQTLTTDAAGGQYKGDVHRLVRNEVVKGDADLVCDSFNRNVVSWLMKWNFPTAQPPKVWRRVSEDKDLRPLAERDQILFGMGLRPSTEYIRATYGEGWSDSNGVES
ncbi:MAG: DUF935 family protein [Magnetococcales bacterium]|nr:DUF935 family protein [Magnetococcales bacterium]MBF0437615.1 DUF935 family protein [Magnetococcales bacterium]